MLDTLSTPADRLLRTLRNPHEENGATSERRQLVFDGDCWLQRIAPEIGNLADDLVALLTADPDQHRSLSIDPEDQVPAAVEVRERDKLTDPQRQLASANR